MRKRVITCINHRSSWKEERDESINGVSNQLQVIDHHHLSLKGHYYMLPALHSILGMHRTESSLDGLSFLQWMDQSLSLPPSVYSPTVCTMRIVDRKTMIPIPSGSTWEWSPSLSPPLLPSFPFPYLEWFIRLFILSSHWIHLYMSQSTYSISLTIHRLIVNWPVRVHWNDRISLFLWIRKMARTSNPLRRMIANAMLFLSGTSQSISPPHLPYTWERPIPLRYQLVHGHSTLEAAID